MVLGLTAKEFGVLCFGGMAVIWQAGSFMICEDWYLFSTAVRQK
jgi:hypothetical protein